VCENDRSVRSCCCNTGASSLTVVEGPQSAAAAAAAPPPGGVCAADIFACWDLVRHPTGAVARSFHPQYCNHVPSDCTADINNCSRMSFLALESNSWQVRHYPLIWTRRTPIWFNIRFLVLGYSHWFYIDHIL